MAAIESKIELTRKFRSRSGKTAISNHDAGCNDRFVDFMNKNKKRFAVGSEVDKFPRIYYYNLSQNEDDEEDFLWFEVAKINDESLISNAGMIARSRAIDAANALGLSYLE